MKIKINKDNERTEKIYNFGFMIRYDKLSKQIIILIKFISWGYAIVILFMN